MGRDEAGTVRENRRGDWARRERDRTPEGGGRKRLQKLTEVKRKHWRVMGLLKRKPGKSKKRKKKVIL